MYEKNIDIDGLREIKFIVDRKIKDIVKKGSNDQEISNNDLLDLCTLNLLRDKVDEKQE